MNMLPQISKTQLNIVRETESEIFAFCPNHQDRNTPNFWITKDNSFGYCFACGFKARIKDLGINMKVTRTPKKREKKDWHQIWSKYFDQDYSLGLSAWELADEWDISDKVLYQQGLCTIPNECYIYPMLDDHHNIIGLQKRYVEGRKRNMKGSRLGLFLCPANFLTTVNDLYITEGFSDTCVCTDLGFITIGKVNAKTCTNLIINHCKIFSSISDKTKIKIISDNDKVGIEGSRELQQGLILNGFKNVIVKVPEGSKDLRAFRDKHGKEYTRKWLLA